MARTLGVNSQAGSPVFADIRSGILLAAALAAAAIHNFLGVAVFALFGAIAILAGGRDLRISPLLTHTFAIALVVCTFGLIPNVTPFPVRFEEMLRFSSYVLLAACLSFFTKRSILIAIALVLSAILATYAVYLATGNFSVKGDFEGRRFASIFIHANHLAYACSFMSLVAVVEILSGRNDPGLRVLTWMIFGLASFILVVSMSSGGLLALVAGSLVAAAAIGSGSRKLLFFVLLMGAMALIFMFTNAFEMFAEKVLLLDAEQIYRRARLYKFGGGAGSLAWRVTYWKALFDTHMANTWFHVLFGTGGGASSEGNYPYFFMMRDPHNDFVKLLIEYGVFGTSLIVAILLNLCRKGRELFPFFTALFIGMFAGNTLGATAVMGIFFVCLSAHAPRSYVWRPTESSAWRPAGTTGEAFR